MFVTTKNKAGVLAASVLALTAAGVVAGTGSSAAPRTAGDASTRLERGWPVSSDSSTRQAVRDARAAARDDGGSVITLLEKVRRFEFLDVGAAGESAGDAFVFESALFTPDGERVGRDSVQCTLRIRTGSCDATFQLSGRGKITVSGAFFGSEPQLAITGGTRAFRDAGGQFIPLDVSEDTTRLVFQLTD